MVRFREEFLAGNQGWVSAFRSQPKAALIVESQGGMHAADFRITFQGQIDCHRSASRGQL